MEDKIYRQLAIDTVCAECERAADPEKYGGCLKEDCSAKAALNNLPTACERPSAHWEKCNWVEVVPHGWGAIKVIKTPPIAVYCTHCRHAFKKELLWSDNYCPNCGADMRGETE